MQFLSLKIHNFGVFRGWHHFDLRSFPGTAGSARNLTVVSGHNGAGKSTLFQAMALAVHGRLFLGDRISQSEYSQFLLSRLHRRREAGGSAMIIDHGGVHLSFLYVRSGQPVQVEVHREWRRSGNTVHEELLVLEDGEPPDIDPGDYQFWLNDLLPPDISPLVFFDAERLNKWTNGNWQGAVLGESLRRLLGLHLVERLLRDIEYLTYRKGGNQSVERLRQRVLDCQALLDQVDQGLGKLNTELEVLSSKREELEAKAARKERELAAEGGTYAAKRSHLRERLAEVEAETEAVSDQLRGLCTDLLPFSLAPELCEALRRRLDQEVELRRQQIAAEVLAKGIEELLMKLGGNDFWDGLRLDDEVKQIITQRLRMELSAKVLCLAPGEHEVLHHLAKPERERLSRWIEQAVHIVPEQVHVLAIRLKRLREERERIQADLKRAPEEKVLASLYEEIGGIENALSDVRQRQAAVVEKIGALQFQRNDQERALKQAHDEFVSAQSAERELALAHRSRLALRAYYDALSRRRLEQLEQELVRAFNTICRKEKLLKGAQIDPEGFLVHLHGTDGQAVEFEGFSAGEKELYALAVLWALRRISGRQLPLVIDAPMARLDETHRRRLVSEYVPLVSDQVVLFATEAELDKALLAHAEPYLAGRYRLHYDDISQETIVATDRLAVRELGKLE